MAATPESLLAAATSLGRGSSEEDWRNATSRAYYAAFHRCQQLAQEANLPVAPSGSIHRTLVDAMTDRFTSGPAFTSLGYILDLCRRRRVEADYNIDTDFPQSLAHEVLEDCRDILDRANALE